MPIPTIVRDTETIVLPESGSLRKTIPPTVANAGRGDYTKVTYLHGKGERIANVTRQVGS